MDIVQRYEPVVVNSHTSYGYGVTAGMAPMPSTSSAPGWYSQADYYRLECEIQRLEKIESAALAYIHERGWSLSRSDLSAALERNKG